MPEWYGALLMAEAWGVPPWRLDTEAPALWVDRFLVLHNAQAKAAEKKAGTGRRLL